jgi:hypothetical protein
LACATVSKRIYRTGPASGKSRLPVFLHLQQLDETLISLKVATFTKIHAIIVAFKLNSHCHCRHMHGA